MATGLSWGWMVAAQVATAGAAPAASPVLLDDPIALFGPAAYPAEAVRARQQGRVVATLLIAADGRVIACDVAEGSGSDLLDARTCRIAFEQMHFTPAKDANGKAVTDTYPLRVRWALPPPRPAPPPAP